MLVEELLPKPELDLPLPEKELPSGEKVESQSIIRNENPPKESRHLIRAFLFGILLVVILVAIGGAYLLGINNSNNKVSTVKIPTPSAITTKTLQTYEGNSINFKYPTSLYLFDCSTMFTPKSTQIHLVDDETIDCNEPLTSSQNLIIINEMKDFKEVQNVGKLNERDEETVKVDGKIYTLVTGNYEVLGSQGEKISSNPIRSIAYVLVPYKNTNLLIEYSRISQVTNTNTSYEVQKDLSDDFKQILSTFKITNTNEANNLTDLKTVNATPIKNPNLSTYTNTAYNYSFQYPKDFVINKSSTKDSISFLQKQDDLMAQRILSYVDINKENLSLNEYANKNAVDSTETKAMKISGHDAILISKTFNLKKECGYGEETQITRTKALIIQMDKGFLNFNTSDSCETYKTDWFSQIIPTIYFTN